MVAEKEKNNHTWKWGYKARKRKLRKIKGYASILFWFQYKHYKINKKAAHFNVKENIYNFYYYMINETA